MTPQRFEVDQAVTPNTGNWSGPGPNPQFGNIYHVLRYWSVGCAWFIQLKELDGFGYEETGFDPVVNSDALAEELSQIELEVTV